MAGAFVFTHTEYLLKLVIPKANALPRWKLKVETKINRTLRSSSRPSFDELTNAKNIVLHSTHFALNWLIYVMFGIVIYRELVSEVHAGQLHPIVLSISRRQT
jgi:hypothetical protein